MAAHTLFRNNAMCLRLCSVPRSSKPQALQFLERVTEAQRIANSQLKEQKEADEDAMSERKAKHDGKPQKRPKVWKTVMRSDCCMHTCMCCAVQGGEGSAKRRK